MSSSGIGFALNELEAISDYFGYPAFVAILAIIATDLQAAFNKRALPFGETVTACLSLFTPDYYRNKNQLLFGLPDWQKVCLLQE